MKARFMKVKKQMLISGVVVILLVMVIGGMLVFNGRENENDAVYEQRNAYIFQDTYTYAVSAQAEGDYDLDIEGAKLYQEVSFSVNGIQQEGEVNAGKVVKIHLNKGINSLSFRDGSKVKKVIIKDCVKSKQGAYVTYDSYEAENADTNASISEEDRTYRSYASEASGRKYVALQETGDYVSFALQEDTNAFVLRYAIPDSEDGKGMEKTLNFYAGDDKGTIAVNSKYSWVYGNFPWSNNPKDKEKGDAHRFFDDVRVKLDKTYPAGTVIKLQKDTGNEAEYYLIDVMETELVDSPIPMNENALNVVDFGAVADDGKDDAKAIASCIEQAYAAGKEVYLPEGTFEIGNPVFVRGFVLNKNDITIRGAGMWHTILHGNASAFSVRAGNISFYDFSLMGEVTQRKDSIDPPAFDLTKPMKGMENIHLQNIWMEHWKVGIWADVTNGMNIIGCRIRNTFADGINLCGGTSNSMVAQNDIRNTGDDAIAMFNRGVLCVNNKVQFNTVSLPWLANNVALYGGKDIEITDNWLKDTICFGSGVNISTNFKPQVFEGTILVERNLFERCGSKENNIMADYGAIWMNTVEGFDNVAQCTIKNNVIKDSTYQGISFFNKGLLENMVIEKNVIDGCGTYGIEVGKETNGFATIRDNDIKNTKLDAVRNYAGKNFIMKE